VGTAPYVELHCHSAYSFLDGVSQPHELARRAAELGHGALALTDHNSVSGSMELAFSARDCGVRAIHGAEVDVRVAGGAHLTLLVENGEGWRSLCRILTAAHAHTRERAQQRGEPSLSLDELCAHSTGLVCLTGCAERSAALAGGEGAVRALREAFGPERLYVELQRPFHRGDRARNRALEALARRLGLRTVATGDVHAHDAARAELQDAFVAIRHGATLEACEPQRRGNHSHVLTTPQAMVARFADHPWAVRETLALSERLTFDLTRDLGYRYPGAEDGDAERRLAELCRARLGERYEPGRAEARLEQELTVISRLGLAGFFLLHHDMLELAREVAVEVRGPDSARALLAPGRGRGSSVSSLVCYLIGLSHIDPVAGELALGRFLHEDLTGLPDIDLDFPRDIRERLIPRVHERYGRERSALVAAFPTFRARGAIRELGKVLGLPAAEIERLARGADRFDEGPVGALRGRHGVWAWLGRLVAEAQGLPRHLSQHSGGMIVATRPLIDCCPVVPAAMEGRQIVQWDKDSCADAGFLKIDLLGLGMLSAVERCVADIERQRGERVDLSRIPLDDEETFRAIRDADTVGVFQIESRAQMQSLLRTQPMNLKDLTIQVAIIRPGPIQGGAVNPYIERRRRLLADPGYRIPYDHPVLEPVLGETLGTIIFQDQVMQVAEVFAGLSPGEADGLRRVMSRKRGAEEMQARRERFITGAQEHVGAERPVAERVWTMIEGFAGFGFPKSHSAAFGLLAYQSTWLRVHYPAELLCALLNEQPMGFYAPDSLVHEAQRRGLEVLPVDVNRSAVPCAVERGAVRIGLNQVKGLSQQDAAALVEARAGGPFTGPADLASRSGLGRPALERLAWSGACDELTGGERRVALWQLGVAAAAGPAGQLALDLELPQAPRLRALGRWPRLLADYATTGVTLHEHALAVLRPHLELARLVTSAQLARLPSGGTVALAGLVIARQKPQTANGTMFLLFEDEFGTVNLIVPQDVYERHRALARSEPLLLAHGRLERSQGPATPGEAPRQVINLLVRELEPLARHLPRRISGEAEPATVSTIGGESGGADDLATVAPPVQSFASGRRR